VIFLLVLCFQYIEEYELKEGFNYLNQTNCYEKDNVSDDNHKEYLAKINAMEALGINSEDQVCFL